MRTKIESSPTTRLEAHYGDRMVRCFADRADNLCDILSASVERCPDCEALVAGDARYTWRELDVQVARFAAWFAARSIRPGDRIALLLENRAEFVIAFFAALRVGAITVPLNVREQAPELAYMLRHSGARLIVHEEALASRLPDAALVPELRHRLGLAACDVSEPFPALSEALDPVGAAAIHEEDVAALLYTSGTTGRPKAAILTHLGMVHSALHYSHAMKLTEGDRLLSCVPLSHVTGLVAMMATAVSCGATLLILRTFNAERFVALAAKERMTFTLMVPAMYNICLLEPHFERHDLSSWRVGGYGGAPMPAPVIERLAQMLPSLTLVNIYGATETTSPATMMVANSNDRCNDSVGLPVPCAHVVVMDESGQQAVDGASGELWIGGPMVARGYWGDPVATAAEFTGGYWHSGDIGSIDADGFVRIFDRKKDVINRGGYKVYAIEVEAALAGHAAVAESAVVAKPCPVLGERVHAFVTVTDSTVDASTLKAYCSALLADYKVPDSFTLLTEFLPRNANGKILKRHLRDSLITGTDTAAS